VSPVLLGVGFLAGLLTIISPCVLPVLPAVLASAITQGGRRRAFAIASGLALAFGATALLSVRILEALHLPLGLRYDFAIVVLFALAAGFIFPQIGQLIERPFARLTINRADAGTRSGFVLGACLGMLYLPCGGPILGAISAIGQTHKTISGAVIGLTIAYSLGIALPVFGLVLAADRMTTTSGWLRTHAASMRRTGGVLLLASAVAITFGAATTIQDSVKSYTTALENHLAGSSSVSNDLNKIKNGHETQQAKNIQKANSDKTPTLVPMADSLPSVTAKSLHNYGPAPDFTDVAHWFNTANGQPLTISQLRGKVVLVDFWTYSCINCLRSLPHVKALYAKYKDDGFIVVGVHTPEFDFEHVQGNVQSAISRLGVTYPVEMDNNYGTWDAWGNNSWPAEYVIDANGDVRYGSIGEGEYGETEAVVRALLNAKGVKSLPPPTDVPDRTPTQQSTPESYLGYERLARYTGSPSVVKNKATNYTLASKLKASQLSYGGTWTVGADDITAGPNATLEINIDATEAYLVLSGTGAVTATLNGKPLATQHVSGVPELYTIVSGSTVQHGILKLQVPQGVEAYDFTFG
jgi:cytochrome c biogenesis protein CcdA/thiol-disulfide isomerase/thioredoxin